MKDEIIEEHEECVESKAYDQILDTKFHYDVPYLVDVEKYKATVNSFHDRFCEHMPTRLTDENAKTLMLSCEWKEEESRYVLYTWVHGRVKNGDWCYDCFIFHYVNKEYFNQCIIDITKCFVKIDEDAVNDIKKSFKKDKAEIERKMEVLDNIVFNFEE